MYIDENKCISCGNCTPYCPMNCINQGEVSMEINLEECVECGICLRNAECPTEAIYQTFLKMPRAVRKAFSDPFGKHENTELKHMGRGTEEVKTNDVTGIVHSLDKVAIAIEMGRPGVGARFKDFEKITRAISGFNVEYEKNNPVTPYILDKASGIFDPEILNEKVLSGIIEFRIPTDKVEEVLNSIQSVEGDVETVFSVCIISKIDENNNPSVEDVLVRNGYPIRKVSSKTNMGLGRPLYEDRIKGEK